jgi:hypothetical protein
MASDMWPKCLRPMTRSVTGTPISGHVGTVGVTSVTVMDPAQGQAL